MSASPYPHRPQPWTSPAAATRPDARRGGPRSRWSALPRWQRRGLGLLTGAAALAAAAPLLAGPLVSFAANVADLDVSGADLDEVGALDQRSVVHDAAGEEMAVLHDEVDRRLVELDDVPDHVVHAVLAAEDQRFREHEGYDVRAIGRAAAANLRAGGVTQGASTITQQVAQQSFLGREETVARKAEEILYAVSLEQEYDTDTILERYLNEVYFGSGAYGIAAAAEQFFRADVDELTPDQAALLAGLIRSPASLDPREQPERARARRDQVLAGMADSGWLDRSDAERLRAQPVDVQPRLQREPDDPYVLEAIKREFTSLEEFGDDPEERFEQLFAGGLEIHTTVDRRLQQLADEVVTDALSDSDGPTAALVALDPRSEAVRALHGGLDFEETQFDLATQARRQPGSALKPVVAAAALEDGLAADTTLDGDSPRSFAAAGAGAPWEVNNFGDASHGEVGLAEATAQSVNTAFAQLMLTAGIDNVVETAGRLGVNTEGAFGSEDSWGPSIALGGLTHGVTPLELAGVYGAFADQGRTGSPYLIEQVIDASGDVVYEREPEAREQALHPGTNAEMVELLRGVVDHGTGTAAQLANWDVIGKTGTTDDNTDAWFAGATATLSTAVWVGHPDEQVPMGDMTGGSLPAQMWQAFTAPALEGHEPRSLPVDPDATPPEPESITVPDLTGDSVGEAMLKAGEDGLVGQASSQVDDHQIVRHQSPSPGTPAVAGDTVRLRVSQPDPTPRAVPEPSHDDSQTQEPAGDPADDDEADEPDEPDEPDDQGDPDGVDEDRDEPSESDDDGSDADEPVDDTDGSDADESGESDAGQQYEDSQDEGDGDGDVEGDEADGTVNDGGGTVDEEDSDGTADEEDDG